MRGRLTVGTMLAALLTNLALAGCGTALPAEVDTELTDDWVKVADVKGWVPEAGVCLGAAPKDTGRYTDSVVDCAKTHHAEVVHVGEFPGLTAAPGPKDTAAAFAECDKQSATYLGRPWGEARLELTLAVPTPSAWDGGARWFRCDVTEVSSVFDEMNWVKREGSLKGAVPAALVVGCTHTQDKGATIVKMPEVPCTKAHNSEFVGFYRASMTTAYPKSERQWNVIHDKCQELAAKFIGVSTGSANRIGVISSPHNAEAWASGDRVVRCSVWFYDGKTMKKSAKATKGKGVPGW
ncbi:septum formation family protein [Catellatospora sichuanensis]|uniref:septum formation family protein n=1 Tax=Catellatospora sichuanensis TaxID=1969805 RepID=UPI0011825D93|nr:septum formation family protein [Catellatospora sichuanensis]